MVNLFRPLVQGATGAFFWMGAASLLQDEGDHRVLPFLALGVLAAAARAGLLARAHHLFLRGALRWRSLLLPYCFAWSLWPTWQLPPELTYK